MPVTSLESFRERKINLFPTEGSNALQPALTPENPIKPQLKLVESLSEQICTEGYVAKKAGVVARGIQSRGLAKVDREVAKYEQTGVFTEDTARATYNAFVRMAIVRGNGNVANVSGAIRLPEGVSPHFLLEDIGQKTLGTEARASRYGRMSLMIADFDEVDYAQLFSRLTEATSEMHSQHFSSEEARVLNGLQEKRAGELSQEVNRVKGIVEGQVAPDIAAISDESKGKEYFLWTGKRSGGKITGINPDGKEQNQSELREFAPDLVTRGLLAHELDLLLSAEEGKVRVIIIGDNEAYVKRCCVATTNEQHEDEMIVTSSNIETQIKELSPKLDLFSTRSLKTSTHYSGGGSGSARYDNENCSTCGKDKIHEGGCQCNSEKAKAA